MSTLKGLLEAAVARDEAPGAAALVDRAGTVERASAGDLQTDSIVRIASLTKPITAAALMLLVDDGLVAVDDPIPRWLPELAAPTVVRTPDAPVDDVVPAARPVTVEDLLTFRAGWGFPDDFSLPAVGVLFERLPVFDVRETPEEWLRTLASVPMLRQPGDAWLYNTCSDIQGVLIARIAKRPLAEVLAERIFEPLEMVDTAFQLPGAEPPVFASGGGGLVSTLADWHRFALMLLADGGGLLSRESVRRMTTDHLTQEQRDASTLFLEGAGWGYGGSVGPGARYGWVGGTGTTAHVDLATGTGGILFTQRHMTGPTPPPLMRAFWDYAFGA
jgi:CubicO group peptidase (beta-lactamase class C family)